MSSPTRLSCDDRAIKIDRIPVHDRTDDEVETRGAERLAFERPVADLAALVEENSALSTAE
jgi:hypothetical protein